MSTSVTDLTRLWLLKALGINDPSAKSNNDLKSELYDPGRLPAAPIQGTGFPKGVVTAEPGTEYVDTDATNGAVKWIKASGSGNTGWAVVYGDTGWRNITADLLNGWAATNVYIKRVGNVVKLRVEAIDASASTSTTFYNLTGGFKTSTNPQTNYRIWCIGPLTTANTDPFPLFPSGQLLRLNQTVPISSYGQGEFDTDDLWPSVLPGTSV